MIVCQGCKEEWKGNSYKRSSGRTDYRCKCGSKAQPIKDNKKTVLAIGDTHAPFTHPKYHEFLKKMYDKYGCDEVVHLGDEIDHHAMSRHQSDPDGMSALNELEAAVAQITELAKIFPKMKLCYGNHTLIPQRQAFDQGISKKFMKSGKDVLLEMGAPVHNWEWSDSWVIDEVEYCHGIGRIARARMAHESRSVVQGHIHSKAYIEWLVNKRQRLFAVQVGAGIDETAYAFAYGKHFQSSILSCAIIVEGKTPIIEVM